jgi:hypothetical protein
MRDNLRREGTTSCPIAVAVRAGEYPVEAVTASETNDVDNSIMISGGVIAPNWPQAIRNLSLSAAVTSNSFSLFFISKFFSQQREWKMLSPGMPSLESTTTNSAHLGGEFALINITL